MPAPDNRPAVALPANPIGMSPLTGRPIGSYKPVLVVKLDNTPNAQPHAGLIDADVVYIEEVEYGITRLAAVFSSTVPRRIGPVRSARITDIDLFAQYGKPAFGYSGAQRKMFPYLKAASIYDVSPYTGSGYSRDNGRRIPYNMFFDGRAGVKRAPKATPARDMGFVFDEQVPDGRPQRHRRLDAVGLRDRPASTTTGRTRSTGSRSTAEPRAPRSGAAASERRRS